MEPEGHFAIDAWDWGALVRKWRCTGRQGPSIRAHLSVPTAHLFPQGERGTANPWMRTPGWAEAQEDSNGAGALTSRSSRGAAGHGPSLGPSFQ